MRFRSAFYPVVTAGIILLAGCGGDGASATPSPTPLPTAKPTVTSIPTPTVFVLTPTPTAAVALYEHQIELNLNRQVWQSKAIESYRFEYRRICFCLPEFVAPVDISVRGGTISDVTFVETGLSVSEPDTPRYETVAGLFDLIQDAIEREAYTLFVKYDADLGYPTEVSIDYDARIADEELGFAVSNLRTAQALSIEGHWEGVNQIAGQELAIIVDFDITANGLTATIDIPLQGAIGLDLSEVRFDGSRAHFELETPVGVAVWDGELIGETISGEFSQADFLGTFSLTRGKMAADEPVDEPVPYIVEEVTFDSGGITLAGTLTLPSPAGPYPAVVLITGSGAQDRNEEIFGFKIFQQIADRLSRSGIAVLRWDDRGVGGSTGDLALATLEDLAGDVESALGLLRDRAEIDAGRIGLLGHSEGGLVALLVAAESDDIAFAVLMAGPAVSTTVLLETQGDLILRAQGATEEQIAEQRRVQAILFDAVRTDQGWDEAAEAIRQAALANIASLSEDERALLGDIHEYAEAFVQGQLATTQTRAFKFFLDYDPRPNLERLTVPVLALFGGLDIQVPPGLNVEPMKLALEAAGNEDVTIEVIEGANHLFQAAVLGTLEEYAILDKEFVPGFLDTIADWLITRTGSVVPP